MKKKRAIVAQTKRKSVNPTITIMDWKSVYEVDQLRQDNARLRAENAYLREALDGLVKPKRLLTK